MTFALLTAGMTWAQSPKATVLFGKYYQDNEGQMLSPVEWNVLDEKGGKTLLITAKTIDSKPFHQKRKAVTWDRCDLRQWLNGAFLQTAFTDEEQSAIAVTDLPAVKNPRFDTPVGKATRDKVFLLSYEECLRYMPTDADRKNFPTEYAVAQGCYVNTDGHAAWWLRSNGMNKTEPEHLATWGNFSLRHHHVDDPIIGDRPAVWVNTEYLNKQIAKTMEQNLNEVAAFLKECHVFYIATVEGRSAEGRSQGENQPRVRPFGVAEIVDGKLYLTTGRKKDVWKQIEANEGRFEICAQKDGEWLRISGRLVDDDNAEVRQTILDRHKYLTRMYTANDGNFVTPTSPTAKPASARSTARNVG